MIGYYWLLSPVAILISATVGGNIALNVARKQKAIDFILNTKSDDRVQAGLSVIRSIHVNQHDEIYKYAYSFQPDPQKSDTSQSNIEEQKQKFEEYASAIRYTLNHFEYMAVGVAEGIYCETILNRSMHNTIVKLYERTEKFITEVRTLSGQKSAHEEFETLAKRWDKNKNWKKDKSLVPRFFNSCFIIHKKP